MRIVYADLLYFKGQQPYFFFLEKSSERGYFYNDFIRNFIIS
jgi:hypothetical protein